MKKKIIKDLLQLIEDFIAYLISYRNLSKFTVRNYKNDLKSFKDFINLDNNILLKDIDKSLIRKYVHYLNTKGYKRSSINRKLSVLRSLFNYVSTNSDFDEITVPMISKSKIQKKLPSIISIEQTDRLISSIDVTNLLGVRDRALIETLYTTGMRVSEISSLNIDDIIDKNKIKLMGKGAKPRVVFMSDTARTWTAALGRYPLAESRGGGRCGCGRLRSWSHSTVTPGSFRYFGWCCKSLSFCGSEGGLAARENAPSPKEQHSAAPYTWTPSDPLSIIF